MKDKDETQEILTLPSGETILLEEVYEPEITKPE